MELKDSRRYLIIAALAIAAFFLSYTALKGKKTVVVAAARPMQAGTEIADGDVTLIPVAKAPTGAFKKPQDLVGKQIHVERLPGDIITADMLGPAPQNSLLDGLPKGWRAIGVKVTRDEALGGLLRKGDTVGVVGIVHLNQTVGAKVVLSGLRVLFVPEEFRYKMQTAQSKNAFSPVSSTRTSKEDTVVLGVPSATVPISFALTSPVTATVTPTVGITATAAALIKAPVVTSAVPTPEASKPITMTVVNLSPLEVLALLNAQGNSVHLFLEEPGDAQDGRTPGVLLQALMPSPREGKKRETGWGATP